MSENILEIRHLGKSFGTHEVLRDIDFTVKKGDVISIIGASGSGKSTLMNVLSGIYPYGSYEGDIIYQGEVCQFKVIKDSEAKGIVIIHQELALVPYLSIGENMYLGNERGKKFHIDGTKLITKQMLC